MATQCVMQTKFTAGKSFHSGDPLVRDGDIDILRRGKTGGGGVGGGKEINK